MHGETVKLVDCNLNLLLWEPQISIAKLVGWKVQLTCMSWNLWINFTYELGAVWSSYL